METPYELRITTRQRVPALLISEHRRSGCSIYRGLLHGEALYRLLPVLRAIVQPVTDDDGVPLELQRYMTHKGLRIHDNLPMDEEAGTKLALIFRLQERVTDLDRVELMARRVARFTREEAAYWLGRITTFGPAANRWATAGLRIMLAGPPGDPATGEMLEELKVTH